MSKAVFAVKDFDGAGKTAGCNTRTRAQSFLALSNQTSLIAGSSSLLNTTRPLVQPKLRIGAPNDRYEQEADMIADMVVDTDFVGEISPIREKPRPGISSLGTKATPLQRTLESPEDLEDGILQTKIKFPTGSETVPDIEADLSSLGTGSTLPAKERELMEYRMGFDFSHVRTHNDNRSAAMAKSINARAFTLGKNIVFGRGEYMPGTKRGRRLLAHELTHVVQQGQAPGIAPVRQNVLRGRNDSNGGSIIRRMAWNPNTDTGRDVAPWRSLPQLTGDLLNAATDAGTAVNTWRPHDGSTYWCHGFTFGGSTASGGPYSAWGSDVPGILNDDGWRRISYCNARNNDILVFYGRTNSVSGPRVAHSGIIRSVSSTSSSLNERRSTLESKWGPSSHNTSSWSANVDEYGFYRIYSRTRARASGCGTGPNELP